MLALAAFALAAIALAALALAALLIAALLIAALALAALPHSHHMGRQYSPSLPHSAATIAEQPIDLCFYSTYGTLLMEA